MTNAGIFIACFLVCLLMFMLGMIHAKNIISKKPDGMFFVNFSDPEDEFFKMRIDIPIEDIPSQKYLVLKVQKTQQE